MLDHNVRPLKIDISDTEFFVCSFGVTEMNLIFKHNSLLFQLHDHEDVLESGADRASDVWQDHTDDRKTTRGPT